MPVASPPVWSDPTNTAVDVATGGIWTQTAIDAVCSDLTTLGGKDGSSGTAGPPSNQLVNGGMEVAQRGTGPFTANGAYTLDRWVIVLGGTSTASVTQSSAQVDVGSGFSAAVSYTYAAGGSFALQQKIEQYKQLLVKTCTFTARVYTSVAGCFATITDGGGQHSGNVNSTVNNWETISATIQIASGSTAINVAVNLPAASCTVNIDNCTLTVGSVPVTYTAIPPAEEWARCKRYYQNTQASCVSNQSVAGASFADTVYFQEMYAIPTVTLTGGSFVNLAGGSPSVTNTTTNQLRYNITGAASTGAVGAFDQTVILESNP